MAGYVPPGWPDDVLPPGSEDWESTAVAWLLDQVPEYRPHTAVSRHPIVLASVARHLIHGTVEGAREGYRTVRSELGELVPPHAVDAALAADRAEGHRLAAAEHAVDLVERALRGGVFRPRLLGSENPKGHCSRPRIKSPLLCVPACSRTYTAAGHAYR